MKTYKVIALILVFALLFGHAQPGWCLRPVTVKERGRQGPLDANTKKWLADFVRRFVETCRDCQRLSSGQRIRERMIPLFEEVVAKGKKAGGEEFDIGFWVSAEEIEKYPLLTFVEFLYSMGFRPSLSNGQIADHIRPEKVETVSTGRDGSGNGCLIIKFKRPLNSPKFAKRHIIIWFKDPLIPSAVLGFEEMKKAAFINVGDVTMPNFAFICQKIKNGEFMVSGLDLLAENETLTKSIEAGSGTKSPTTAAFERVLSIEESARTREEFIKAYRAALRKAVEKKEPHLFIARRIGRTDSGFPMFQIHVILREELGMIPFTSDADKAAHWEKGGIRDIAVIERYSTATPPALGIRLKVPLNGTGKAQFDKTDEHIIFVRASKDSNEPVRDEDTVVQYADYNAYERVCKRQSSTPMPKDKWEGWRRAELIKMAKEGLLFISGDYIFKTPEDALRFADLLGENDEERSRFRHMMTLSLDPNRYALRELFRGLTRRHEEVSGMIITGEDGRPQMSKDIYNKLKEFGLAAILLPEDMAKVLQRRIGEHQIIDRIEVVEESDKHPAALRVFLSEGSEFHIDEKICRDVFVFFRDPATGRFEEDIEKYRAALAPSTDNPGRDPWEDVLGAIRDHRAVTSLDFIITDWDAFKAAVLGDADKATIEEFKQLEFYTMYPRPRFYPWQVLPNIPELRPVQKLRINGADWRGLVDRARALSEAGLGLVKGDIYYCAGTGGVFVVQRGKNNTLGDYYRLKLGNEEHPIGIMVPNEDRDRVVLLDWQDAIGPFEEEVLPLDVGTLMLSHPLGLRERTAVTAELEGLKPELKKLIRDARKKIGFPSLDEAVMDSAVERFCARLNVTQRRFTRAVKNLLVLGKRTGLDPDMRVVVNGKMRRHGLTDEARLARAERMLEIARDPAAPSVDDRIPMPVADKNSLLRFRADAGLRGIFDLLRNYPRSLELQERMIYGIMGDDNTNIVGEANRVMYFHFQQLLEETGLYKELVSHAAMGPMIKTMLSLGEIDNTEEALDMIADGAVRVAETVRQGSNDEEILDLAARLIEEASLLKAEQKTRAYTEEEWDSRIAEIQSLATRLCYMRYEDVINKKAAGRTFTIVNSAASIYNYRLIEDGDRTGKEIPISEVVRPVVRTPALTPLLPGYSYLTEAEVGLLKAGLPPVIESPLKIYVPLSEDQDAAVKVDVYTAYKYPIPYPAMFDRMTSERGLMIIAVDPANPGWAKAALYLKQDAAHLNPDAFKKRAAEAQSACSSALFGYSLDPAKTTFFTLREKYFEESKSYLEGKGDAAKGKEVLNKYLAQFDAGVKPVFLNEDISRRVRQDIEETGKKYLTSPESVFDYRSFQLFDYMVVNLIMQAIIEDRLIVSAPYLRKVDVDISDENTAPIRMDAIPMGEKERDVMALENLVPASLLAEGKLRQAQRNRLLQIAPIFKGEESLLGTSGLVNLLLRIEGGNFVIPQQDFDKFAGVWQKNKDAWLAGIRAGRGYGLSVAAGPQKARYDAWLEGAALNLLAAEPAERACVAQIQARFFNEAGYVIGPAFDGQRLGGILSRIEALPQGFRDLRQREIRQAFGIDIAALKGRPDLMRIYGAPIALIVVEAVDAVETELQRRIDETNGILALQNSELSQTYQAMVALDENCFTADLPQDAVKEISGRVKDLAKLAKTRGWNDTAAVNKVGAILRTRRAALEKLKIAIEKVRAAVAEEFKTGAVEDVRAAVERATPKDVKGLLTACQALSGPAVDTAYPLLAQKGLFLPAIITYAQGSHWDEAGLRAYLGEEEGKLLDAPIAKAKEEIQEARAHLSELAVGPEYEAQQDGLAGKIRQGIETIPMAGKALDARQKLLAELDAVVKARQEAAGLLAKIHKTETIEALDESERDGERIAARMVFEAMPPNASFERQVQDAAHKQLELLMNAEDAADEIKRQLTEIKTRVDVLPAGCDIEAIDAIYPELDRIEPTISGVPVKTMRQPLVDLYTQIRTALDERQKAVAGDVDAKLAEIEGRIDAVNKAIGEATTLQAVKAAVKSLNGTAKEIEGIRSSVTREYLKDKLAATEAKGQMKTDGFRRETEKLMGEINRKRQPIENAVNNGASATLDIEDLRKLLDVAADIRSLIAQIPSEAKENVAARHDDLEKKLNGIIQAVEGQNTQNITAINTTLDNVDQSLNAAKDVEDLEGLYESIEKARRDVPNVRSKDARPALEDRAAILGTIFGGKRHNLTERVKEERGIVEAVFADIRRRLPQSDMESIQALESRSNELAGAISLIPSRKAREGLTAELGKLKEELDIKKKVEEKAGQIEEKLAVLKAALDSGDIARMKEEKRKAIGIRTLIRNTPSEDVRKKFTDKLDKLLEDISQKTGEAKDEMTAKIERIGQALEEAESAIAGANTGEDIQGLQAQLADIQGDIALVTPKKEQEKLRKRFERISIACGEKSKEIERKIEELSSSIKMDLLEISLKIETAIKISARQLLEEASSEIAPLKEKALEIPSIPVSEEFKAEIADCEKRIEQAYRLINTLDELRKFIRMLESWPVSGKPYAFIETRQDPAQAGMVVQMRSSLEGLDISDPDTKMVKEMLEEELKEAIAAKQAAVKKVKEGMQKFAAAEKYVKDREAQITIATPPDKLEKLLDELSNISGDVLAGLTPKQRSDIYTMRDLVLERLRLTLAKIQAAQGIEVTPEETQVAIEETQGPAETTEERPEELPLTSAKNGVRALTAAELSLIEGLISGLPTEGPYATLTRQMRNLVTARIIGDKEAEEKAIERAANALERVSNIPEYLMEKYQELLAFRPPQAKTQPPPVKNRRSVDENI